MQATSLTSRFFGRDAIGWPMLIVLAVSIGYESLFITSGLNHLDEAWPVYAAMRLQAGGALYQDALWVFPPAHMWMAWLAYALAPPGIVAARVLYAVWSVALAASMLVLGRRLMAPGFALLGALLLAVAAPRTHLMHALYGYRYLVLAVLALLCFHQRCRTGEQRWMLLAGALAGTALSFRLTPAFAVSCAMAVGAVAADRRWRSWLVDWSYYAVGLLVAVAPVLLWFHLSVGLGHLWGEVVVHPLGMLQDLPWPVLGWPETWERKPIRYSWVALQFRLYWVLYGVYAAVLLVRWARDLAAGRASREPLLIAVVVWGAVFFIRSLGRSDEPHLDSVIPPICLLLAHAMGLGFRWGWPKLSLRDSLRVPAAVLLGALAWGAWVFLAEIDVAIGRDSLGRYPVVFRGETVWISSPARTKMLNELFTNIENKTRPSDRILDMAAAPIFYVGTDRMGPGHFDILMPGTFETGDQERAFLARLQREPPAAVVWSSYAFDEMAQRSVTETAPLISAWVQEHYAQVGPTRRWILMLPKLER